MTIRPFSIAIALFSRITLYLRSRQKEISARSLMFGGLLYIVFFAAVLLST